MINAKTIEGMVERYNPFVLTDTDGNALMFSDYGKMYEYLFELLYEDFKCGLVDLPLFLSKHTNMKLQHWRTMIKRLWLRGETIKLDWKLRSEVIKFQLDFIKFMHKVTHTLMDEDMLMRQQEKFLNRING